jgi:hypothetical protein
MGTTWAAASTLTIASPIPGSLALARYVASIHRRDLFSESGLVAVVIEASLASPQRNSHLVALRKARESERSEYTVLESDGDATVTQKVIAPYLAEDETCPYRRSSLLLKTITFISWVRPRSPTP